MQRGFRFGIMVSGYAEHGLATITAAILDRLLHGAETVVIEGKSCRMKDRHTEEPAA